MSGHRSHETPIVSALAGQGRRYTFWLELLLGLQIGLLLSIHFLRNSAPLSAFKEALARALEWCLRVAFAGTWAAEALWGHGGFALILGVLAGSGVQAAFLCALGQAVSRARRCSSEPSGRT